MAGCWKSFGKLQAQGLNPTTAGGKVRHRAWPYAVIRKILFFTSCYASHSLHRVFWRAAASLSHGLSGAELAVLLLRFDIVE